jgi:hypothetical protein
MRLFYFIFLFSFFSIIASGCKVTNRIPEGQKLYTGANLEYVNPEMVHKPKRTAGEVTSNVRPQPNKKFLGLFYTRLWFNQRIKEPKQKTNEEGETVYKKGIRNWLKYKIGEKPVYLNEEEVRRSELLMEKFLREKGYFGSGITSEVIKEENMTLREKLIINYHILGFIKKLLIYFIIITFINYELTALILIIIVLVFFLIITIYSWPYNRIPYNILKIISDID